MIQNKTDSKLKIYFSDCVKVIRISDILTPASATERFKTLTPDLCYFGDTISQLVKAVQEGTTIRLHTFCPKPSYTATAELTASVLLCVSCRHCGNREKVHLIFFSGKHKKP